MDNRNEPTDMDLIDSPRRTPTPPPLSACEQILQNTAQLQKMETFKKFKLACIAELQAMPDHHPDEPFYRRAVSELQKLKKQLTWRAQANLKKELKIYSNDTWNARLEALNTTDNSLWEAQRFLKNKRSQIPTLNCATGMAVTDPQKANLLANTIKNNFIENNRMQDNYDQDDEVVTSTVNTFLSSPLLLKLNLPCLMKLLTSLKILALKRPRLTESISEGFQKKKSTGVVFLDIQKAFDRVWILGLTFKLITYDIPSPLIHLIHSYLTNRSFRIRSGRPKENAYSTPIQSSSAQAQLLPSISSKTSTISDPQPPTHMSERQKGKLKNNHLRYMAPEKIAKNRLKECKTYDEFKEKY
ncbi:putative RNA-directed DNA polymerase from transposon X-element [Trichonephila clavipes]|nr:putative RNA-directed DNA polymerase from transposon X-element [Trichonephila clavipes]